MKENSVSKPDWLKVKVCKNDPQYLNTLNIVQKQNLSTVCAEAACPNICDCWRRKHAAFMILGNVCTRRCAFCNIQTGNPQRAVDKNEAKRLAIAVTKMGLKHVVITSVTRDDLDDGGASQFASCIEMIRASDSTITIEVLTPDFQGKNCAVKIIANATPDVFNHNIETAPSLYAKIKPGASYTGALHLLQTIKNLNSKIFTKSGLMVGLGETETEVYEVMQDLRKVSVDFLTIGQYLQPSKKHINVTEYIHPDVFQTYAKKAKELGFKVVASSPFTRSSYHADELFASLKVK
jgi:lipoyl synthase